ncbi:diguanylate cyclase [uncultured Piscinibacter sp.]|uniref:diguanylate cyclase domain-containing protein n=1 Tax=uncultured Piscinibacter sp. TaxID=1131835 RepID=UPI00260BD3C7|nr:diguanylate cyclase [uncultured Piscinibacter sp.]
MPSDALITWQFSPALDFAAWALAALAFYVAQDLARRLGGTSGRAAVWWLAGAAVSLGTGLWSMHFVTLAGRPLHIAVGYGGAATAAIWLADVAASAAALRLGLAGPLRPVRVLGAALLFAGVAVATGIGQVTDMRLTPAPHWRALGPGLAVPALAALLAAAVWLAGVPRGVELRWRVSAAALAALGLLGAHRLVALAAAVPQDAVSLNQTAWLADSTLALLAAVATFALGATLLALSVMESRMRLALRAAIERVEAAARTDALTQLPNRLSLEARLDAGARRAAQAPMPMAVLFIALEKFKPVNDSFGRRVGDLLLQATAQRLRAAAGSRGMLARVGGVEFVLMLGPGTGRGEAAEAAQ